MTTLTMRRAGGLPAADQSEPFDPAAYRHQWGLLKSMHCARPVLYRGQKQFVTCLTINGTGTQLDMLVYLAGIRGGIDSAEIEIMQDGADGSEA